MTTITTSRLLGVLGLLALGSADSFGAPTCEATVADLRGYVDALREQARARCVMPPTPLAPLPPSKTARRADSAIQIKLEPSSLTIEEVKLPWQPQQSAKLADRLRAEVDGHFKRLRKIEKLGGPPVENRLVLAIHPETRWAAVVQVVSTVMKAGITQIAFLFRVSVPDPPRPPSRIDVDLRLLPTLPPGERWDLVTARWSQIHDRCPALARRVAEIATLPSAEREDRLLEIMPSSLLECRCEVDVPALMALLTVQGTPFACQEIRASVGTAGKVVSASATALWSDAAGRLVTAVDEGGMLRLVSE